MKQQFEIRHQAHVNRANTILSNLDLTKEWSFEIKPYKRKISVEQRAAYWALLNECIAGGVGGNNAQELHDKMKEDYLIPLLKQHDEEFQVDLNLYYEVARKGNKDLALKLFDRLKSKVSIMDLKVNMMTLYMKSVEGFTSQWGYMIKTKSI